MGSVKDGLPKFRLCETIPSVKGLSLVSPVSLGSVMQSPGLI